MLIERSLSNQPLFVMVWIGSIVAVVAAAGLGFAQLQGTPRVLLISAPLLYILGVQISTFTINVPLNNWSLDKQGLLAQ